VADFCSTHRLAVNYCVEPQQNIALARNMAFQHASGDFIAFIDDDEFPADDWLCALFKACEAYGVAGVLGPVIPYYELEPPQWVKKGGFFDRPAYKTGYKLNWAESRTSNGLIRRSILNGAGAPFRSEFDTAGEDVDFFRRMMETGCAFIWCNEAIVYEEVPSSRCNRSYLLKRALIAVPCYTLVLPFLALFGPHVFLTYLIKLLDHASRLLAFLGLKVVTRRQT
jgi:succinoglycan biosynthesis protein ExoM